ncbi:hypothetical protein EYF80_012634 [Liparis tanakae]|uniref:Uncharacterized protein n=1 Tax=Liparis tanakae TaxID=230148 RepID=A0A4Z2IHK2_9TELE|nr:hypothetical protein EYF80_012634 [Liparis tanakae]
MAVNMVAQNNFRFKRGARFIFSTMMTNLTHPQTKRQHQFNIRNKIDPQYIGGIFLGFSTCTTPTEHEEGEASSAANKPLSKKLPGPHTLARCCSCCRSIRLPGLQRAGRPPACRVYKLCTSKDQDIQHVFLTRSRKLQSFISLLWTEPRLRSLKVDSYAKMRRRVENGQIKHITEVWLFGRPWAVIVSLVGLLEGPILLQVCNFGFKLKSEKVYTKQEAHGRQKLMSQSHDEDICHRSYGEGMLVWLNNPTESITKLAPHWKGPNRVEQALASSGEAALAYRIINPLDPLEPARISYEMIWRGVVGKQGLLRNPELTGKWMQVCSSHTEPARYRDGKHTEWLGDRVAMAQLVARRDHNSRMRREYRFHGVAQEYCLRVRTLVVDSSDLSVSDASCLVSRPHAMALLMRLDRRSG